MTTEDVKKDIASFLQAKVDQVAKDLTKSGAMFLWVYLMLKVVKSLPTVMDILRALSTLPEKVDMMYMRESCSKCRFL